MADCLSVPVFIVDPDGTLVFYNEPAEEVLGERYQDTGAMLVNEWSTKFLPCDEEGKPIPPKDLPLVKTLNTQLPAHGTFWIKGMDGKSRKISVTSYPLIGRSKKFSGAVAIFWTDKEKL